MTSARPGGHEGRKDYNMELNNDQNITFMNDPSRIAAQREVDEIVRHISTDLKFSGNAMYYLTVLPPLLKKLEAAMENLSIVEASVTYEILNKYKMKGVGE